MDTETEILLKEKDEEIARLRTENEASKNKDTNEEQAKLKTDLAKAEAEKKELADKLQHKEYAEARATLLKSFPEVSDDLVPAGMTIEQIKEYAGRLNSKLAGAKANAGVKPADFNGAPSGAPVANPGSTGSPKEEMLRNAQEKRTKFLATLQTKDYNKNSEELIAEGLGTKILY